MIALEIIILSFNTKDDTLRAVRSALGLGQNVQVTVVDNNSHDGTVLSLKALAKQETRLKVIALQSNLGFAGGNNVALRESTAPFLMLLNSDAYFPSGETIEPLLGYMAKHDDVGVITPRVLLGHTKRIDPASHRGFPTPWNSFCYYLGLEKLGILRRQWGGYHQTWKNLKTIHDIDACTGAAMLIRREAMDEVGILDEQFFMYGEDLDWCYRFGEKGWKIVYDPDVTVIHDKHRSGLKNTDHKVKTKAAFYEAMKLFYHKHYAAKYPAWMRTLTFVGIDLMAKVKHR